MSEHVINSLNKVLSSTYGLYLKTQNYHWNVTGTHFHDLHILFESQYASLAQAVDIIAEQIRANGHKAPATFKMYLSLSVVDEGNEEFTWQEMVQDLYQSHLLLSKLLKDGLEITAKANDQVVNDLYLQRLAEHQKAAWMLKSIVG